MIKNNKNIQFGTILALVILCAILSVLKPSFYSYNNLMNIFKQTAFNAFVATGMLLCLITAGIDLSVGANAVFCACVIGGLLKLGITNAFLLIVIAVVSGITIGIINGTLLTKLHLPHPFVSTLGMKNVLWGLALLITNSQMISGFPKEVEWLGTMTIHGFPISFIFVIFLYIVFHFFLTRTALGRSIYCIGGNLEATRLSGINTSNVLTFCYAFSGFMAAIAGILSIGRSGICNGANAIQPYDTDAIAACIIGGASFSGGKGNMFGTLIGCLIIAVLRNGFSLLAIQSSIQNIVLGLVIIVAVLMDVIRAKIESKKRLQEMIKIRKTTN